MCSWATPEKKQTVGAGIWNFLGYQKRSIWNFQDLIKNKLEFPKVTKKIVWNFQGTWFLALIFSRDLTQFCRIFRGEALFYLEFPGVKNEIFHRRFSKKYALNPPVFFSGIAQQIQCLIQETKSHLQWRLILLLIFYIYKTTWYFKTTLREILHTKSWKY